MANVQIGYDTTTGAFTIPESTPVHGVRGLAQAITFTQAPGSTGWDLTSINFGNAQFSQTAGNGSEITVRDAFTDAIRTGHKFTVTITLATNPPRTVTSPDPEIVNDPGTPVPTPQPAPKPEKK